ncbi:ABC transporter substrate-binding protein [Halobacillus sp. A5]|uniref:ABC transporter substrate-binding protein n=1 Tax=Halobacillus sp. A5 TaxID=2880263 RepID=UPI0020A6ADAD|nr:extracellular solute-binding protein [Halobacillus sp. A5]MCP3028484.1 extracellular solute-binding protein [Halobacillus sp. A5]
MKREFWQLCIAGTLSLSLSACTGNQNAEETPSEKKEVTLEIRNPKVEIASQFEQMVTAYEKENPNVTIEVHTVGGAMDDYSDLKAQMAAGDGPDIFTNPGYDHAQLWNDYLEDLSDEPWVDQAYDDTLSAMTFDDKVYGMPMNLEGYGFIYNKDLFEQAGIDSLPETLRELKSAAKQLEDAGITPFATGYYEKWKLGDHLMNTAFAQQDNPGAFITDLNQGTETISNNSRFKELVTFLDVTLAYGSDDPLDTDYSMEVQSFAEEEAAMILQGNWIQPVIDQQAPDMNIGIMPIPINDEAENDSLVVNTPNYWVVNKQTSSQNKKEAKKFLNWMVSSKEGQMHMTEHLKFLPAFKHIEPDSSGPLAKETWNYYRDDQTMSSNWFDFPIGVREDFGAATQQYIKQDINRDQLLYEYQQSWESSQSE